MNILLDQILAAHQRIQPHIRQTPLVPAPFLSERAGGDVWLKLENWQPTGSFKVRGALNKIGRLSPTDKAQGIVAASAGNHALGIGHAVRALGDVQADIFVPSTTPQAKLNKLRRFPVTIHQKGDSYDETAVFAEQFRARESKTAVSAYDDLDVIAGQGTVGLEIMQERPEVDVIFCPVGGGGLLAGVCSSVGRIKPACRLVAVQAAASPSALLSLRDDRAYETYDHEPTIADGLAGGYGAVPFAVTRPFAPDILLASEAELRQAIFALLDQQQLVVEGSSAAAIVPLLRGEIDLAGQTAVCILSGGNLDMALLAGILGDWIIG